MFNLTGVRQLFEAIHFGGMDPITLNPTRRNGCTDASANAQNPKRGKWGRQGVGSVGSVLPAAN